MLAVVAASKAIGAECYQPVAQPGRKLIRNGFHIIAGSNDGAVCVPECHNDIRRLLRIRRMQPVPAFDSQGFPSKFGVAGPAPAVGLDVVLLREDLMRT